MNQITTAQLQKLTAQTVNKTIILPTLVGSYGKPYCAIIPLKWLDDAGLLKMDKAQDDELESIGLTILEKRALIKDFIHSAGISHQAKAKYMELDSKLAGHFAPDKIETITSINEGDRALLQEVINQSLEARDSVLGAVSGVSKPILLLEQTGRDGDSGA